MEIKEDFTFTECEILMSFAMVSNSSDLDYTKLSKNAKINASNSLFWKVANYLKENMILEEVEKIGTSKHIRIHHSNLNKLINKQRVINRVFIPYYKKVGTLLKPGWWST